jgi:hypothetical protein
LRCRWTDTQEVSADDTRNTIEGAAAAGNALTFLQMLPSNKGVLSATADARVLVFDGSMSSDADVLSVSKQLIGTNDDVIDMKFAGEDQSLIAVVSNSEQVGAHLTNVD